MGLIIKKINWPLNMHINSLVQMVEFTTLMVKTSIEENFKSLEIVWNI
jgi:hypothetical protein